MDALIREDISPALLESIQEWIVCREGDGVDVLEAVFDHALATNRGPTLRAVESQVRLREKLGWPLINLDETSIICAH